MPVKVLLEKRIYPRLLISSLSRGLQNRHVVVQSIHDAQPSCRLASSSSSLPRYSTLSSTTLAFRPQPFSSSRIRFQTSRKFSISPKKWAKFKDDGKLAIRYVFYFYAFLILGSLMQFGARDERYNRLFPTPPEWSWGLRHHMRKTRGDEIFFDNKAGIPSWPELGMRYRYIVNRLEGNFKSVDTTKLPMEEKIRLEKAGVPLDGFNLNGVDVSNKSIPWREGYYAALMGAARAAEFLEGFVADVTRREIFSPDRVIGPSNPRPKPQPYGAMEAPLEENCAPAFLSPKFFYRKIMATEGLDARQRLEASLAWANWLSATGQDEEAEDKYDWALDIAMGDLPQGINNVVDTRTGCINEGAIYITEGIITATTALASFHAQQQNFSTAVPIYASILRAYRSLPPPSESPIPTHFTSAQPESAWSLVWSSIVSALSAPAYPDPPPSISKPLISTPRQTCSEAAVMSNLGEIMFASSKSTSPSSAPGPTSSLLRMLSLSRLPSEPIATSAELSGLSWTSSAVDQSEATIDGLINRPPRGKTQEEIQDVKEYCAECLTMAVENWMRMASILEEREIDQERKEKEMAQTQKRAADRTWADWTWSLLFSSKHSNAIQNSPKAPAASADVDSAVDQENPISVAEAKGTILELQQAPPQGPWAQEARKVEQRFLEVRKRIREERIARKDMAQKGLWWGFG